MNRLHSTTGTPNDRPEAKSSIALPGWKRFGGRASRVMANLSSGMLLNPTARCSGVSWASLALLTSLPPWINSCRHAKLPVAAATAKGEFPYRYDQQDTTEHGKAVTASTYRGEEVTDIWKRFVVFHNDGVWGQLHAIVNVQERRCSWFGRVTLHSRTRPGYPSRHSVCTVVLLCEGLHVLESLRNTCKRQPTTREINGF